MIDVAVRYTPRLSTAEQQLLELPNRLRNLRLLMTERVAPAATAMLERHWESKGAAFGHPWAPWAPSTRLARIRKGNAEKGLLRDTDQLFDALFRAVRSARRLRAVPGGVQLLLTPDDRAARLKFGFLQLGTRLMPARQPIPSPLPRSFRAEIRGLIRDFVATGRLRGAGGRFVAAGGARSARA